MEKTCIIVRHGERIKKTKEKSGDGPLSSFGTAITQASAEEIAGKLTEMGITTIGFAVISGSIRCAETFAIYWKALLSHEITVSEYVMDKAYFSTAEEDVEWTKLFTDHLQEFLADSRELGERGAVMKHVPHLVQACVDRTFVAIHEASHEHDVVMVVTHGPHDALIAEQLTGQGNNSMESLRNGKARIVSI